MVRVWAYTEAEFLYTTEIKLESSHIRLLLYFVVHNVLPCIMHTHIFGLSFQEKNPSFQLFTYLYLDTCFLYYKEILAFNFEHIMV